MIELLLSTKFNKYFINTQQAYRTTLPDLFSVFVSVSGSRNIDIFQFMNEASPFQKSSLNLYHANILAHSLIPPTEASFGPSHGLPHPHSFNAR
jgi:hypothetical protein